MKEKYIKLLGIYINKKVLTIIFCVLLIILFLLFQKHTLAMLDFILKDSEYVSYTIGDFRLQNYHGKIKLYDTENRLIYEGDYQKGVYEGKGTLYKDGNRYYTGNFENNQMIDTNGILYYSSGEILYTGNIEDGKMNGNGKTFYQNKQIKTNGTYVNDQLNGYGTLYDDANHIIYEGEFKDDVYHGKGTLFQTSGSKIYEGQFMNGAMQGYGTLYTNTGKLLYEGEMLNDHIYYESLFNISLTNLLNHFNVTPKIYQYQSYTAFSYDELDVMLITKNPVYFEKKAIHKEASKMEETTLLTLDENLNTDEVIFHEIILIKKVWHDPFYAFLNKKQLDTYLEKFGYSNEIEEQMNFHQAMVHLYLNKNKKVYSDFKSSKQSDFITTITSYDASKYKTKVFVYNDYRIKYVYEKDTLLYSMIYAKQGLK